MTTTAPKIFEDELELKKKKIVIDKEKPELELKEKKVFICSRIVHRAFKEYLDNMSIKSGFFVLVIIIDQDSHKMKAIDSSEVKQYMNKYDLSNCFMFKCSYNYNENSHYVDLWTDKKY